MASVPAGMAHGVEVQIMNDISCIIDEDGAGAQTGVRIENLICRVRLLERQIADCLSSRQEMKAQVMYK